jgi:hypothetical protein
MYKSDGHAQDSFRNIANMRIKTADRGYSFDKKRMNLGIFPISFENAILNQGYGNE